jgi:5-methyltetrahydrofolate--homocysteine methyltransferase
VETVLESKNQKTIIGPDRMFVIIGERINPTGRKKLAEELLAGNLDRVRADAEEQTKAGAAMLDVNAGVLGTDEAALLVELVKTVQDVTDLPLSIDSSVAEALEAALPVYEGKALVNSVTAEEQRMERVLPLVKKHQAAVIGMLMDENGISMDPEVRLGIARRIVERASDHGIASEDVVIDPLVMALATDPKSAEVTLETIRLVRRELGRNLTCGASNVSFGMPARRGFNAAFLPMTMYAGLTSAITNPLIPEVRMAIQASDALLGRDPYGVQWLKARREEEQST